jgi:hypothetical protein
VPLLPKSLRGRAESLEADPFSYLRGVLAFFWEAARSWRSSWPHRHEPPGPGSGRSALDLVRPAVRHGGLIFEPAIEFCVQVLTNVGLSRPSDGYSAEEAMAAQGHVEAAAEAYRLRAGTGGSRVDALIRRAQLLAGPLGTPLAAAGELEALQRESERLSPAEDMRLGLALTELYEQKLQDPGRAMVELRRLIDRYPHARQCRELRTLLAALRRQHFAGTTP